MSATPPFAALPTASGLARGHVRATLAEWSLGEFADAAELIASEMTANAVNASAPLQATGTVLVIRLCLVTHGHVLTIECWDQAPGIPVLQEASGFTETGRGLGIIDSLTDGAWGCRPAIGQAGKCVWAEISVRDLPAAHAADGRSEPHELPCGEQTRAVDAAIIPGATGYGTPATVEISEEVSCSAHS